MNVNKADAKVEKKSDTAKRYPIFMFVNEWCQLSNRLLPFAY